MESRTTCSHKKEQLELNKLCEKVFYYKRKNSFISLFSYLPFRVKSRSSKALLQNLQGIKAPILFEGLHAAYHINKITSSKIFVRTHNIEHGYFFGLAKSEKNS